MAILSVKHPILYTGPASGFDYTISLDGNVVYSAHSYNSTVDLSRVFQSYMNSSLVNITDEDLPDISSNSVVKEFTVSGGTSTVTYMVANDYNDDYVTQYDETYITSDSVTGKYHPDGLVFVDVNSPDADATIKLGQSITIGGFNSSQTTTGVDGIYRIEKLSEGTLARIYTFIGFVNGYFVASTAGYISYTQDATSWTETQIPNRPVTFSYGNGMYCFGGTDGILYSNNVNGPYTYVKLTSTTYFANFTAFGNNMFVAISGGSTLYASYSYDAINWTTTTAGTQFFGEAVLSANNKFYAIGNSGKYAMSDDGITWRVLGTIDVGGVGSVYMRDFAYGNNSFVIVLSDGSCRYSTDFMTWHKSETGASADVESITFGQGVFIALSIAGEFCISRDGMYWDTQEPLGTISGVAYGNNIFVGVGRYDSKYYILGLSVEPTIISVDGQSIDFEISSGCERYSLYWVNKLGGRSQLLVEGNTNKRTSHDTFQIRTNYDRSSPSSFEFRTIYNDVTKEYTFNLGWLTDEQYEKINDLMNSPKIWIHDHEKNRIISARISSSSDAINNFVSNRNASKIITLREAQNHIRR